MRPRIQEIVIDCAAPADLARFWGALLESRWAARDDDWANVGADPLLLAFQRVPESKSSPKNRLHLDIAVSDAPEAIARAVALGARELGQRHLSETGDGYVVMADPEDNEFCFVVDTDGSWELAARAALALEPSHGRGELARPVPPARASSEYPMDRRSLLCVVSLVSLAVSAAVLILLIPSFFRPGEQVDLWLVGVLAVLVLAFAAGTRRWHPTTPASNDR
ncbi:VOC family protein [Pengzhenrongella phosphoraccumulans]|uniref:VOC family protein n=1 Tax=Pengzhenrongella phosphoraccumulans TaxID=3114394 RepID=UPI00388F2501